MSDELDFAPLPPKLTGLHGRGETKWGKIARQLKARPGEWAPVCEARRTAGTLARAGLARACPDGKFEAVERRRDDGVVVGWARYVGGES